MSSSNSARKHVLANLRLITSSYRAALIPGFQAEAFSGLAHLLTGGFILFWLSGKVTGIWFSVWAL